MKHENPDTKCEFTLPTATLGLGAEFPAKKTSAFESFAQTEIAMNRRPLVLFALIVASFVASACADISAPHRDGDCSGYIDLTGACVGR
jgi:hypothetical protein